MMRAAIGLSILFLVSGQGLTGAQLAVEGEEQALQKEAGVPEMPQDHGRLLADYLNPDGTLILPPEGIEGSIDPSGFRMVNSRGEAPRFEETGSLADLLVPGDENWDPQFNGRGVNNSVRAFVWDGTNLYVGGDFTTVTASGQYANYLAKWDGNAWSALGWGMDFYIRALVWDGTNLYAGGDFTTAGGMAVNHIARWDGSAWSPLGSGMNGTVRALAWDGVNLYAGGDFWIADGVLTPNIAKWDGSTWSPLGSGMNGYIYTLLWDGANLYAGGEFTTAGGVTANNIAQWNGSAWSGLSTGMNNTVSALAWDGTDLYAGGYFTAAGGVSANAIARWNGSTWSALGSGMDYGVKALVWDGANLYAGGSFQTAGGVSASNIAKWDGSVWSALGSGMATVSWGSASVNALAWDGTSLCAGGDFTTAGGVIASKIAKWDGIAWFAIPPSGSGVNDVVYALAWDGSNLYVGGRFATAGGILASRIARWDGNAWSALDSGMNGEVYALAWGGTSLYAGGSFTTAGGVSAKNIARWNGSTWSPLGSGTNGGVRALAWNGANLYAGGGFTSAGGVPASRIAKWNGISWSAMGSGMNSFVSTLLWGGTNLYAGGGFTTAGGVSANYIARWNGTTWSALGSGMHGSIFTEVKALAWDGTNLYAGGNFATAGGVTANYIAKWAGSTWIALSSGLSYEVNVLIWNGTDLYAGGNFWTAGGVSAEYIAKWNGISWRPLGSGMNYWVKALASDGTSLYTGGYFTTAGGKSSSYIGRWAIPPCLAPSISALASAADADMCAYTGVLLTWPAEATDWGDEGAGTRTYNALRDGAAISNGLPYGTTQYLDTTGVNGSPYAYAVRYNNGCGLYAETAGAIAADLSNAPGTPVIAGISDVNACTQNGIRVNFMPGTGADRHDLYRDGSLAVTGYVSGADYNPGDTGLHEYSVRAVNADCVKISLSQEFSDHTSPSPTITGPAPACSPGTLSTQVYASYQWYRNGFIIHGATTQNYSVVAPGTYSVLVSDAFGCQVTSPGFVINPSPAAPVISGPDTACASDGVWLSTGTYASYQWTKDGVDIPAATAQTTLAVQSGTYRVRVGNAVGCTATSAGRFVTIVNNPQPVVLGDYVNSCPDISVTLSTGAYSGTQWYFNGTPISGATAQNYPALVTGNYSVQVVDTYGCSGQSSEYLVFIDFCPGTEISPTTAIFPLKIQKSAASGTGYYLFFQRVDSTDGYNIYEGQLIAPWDSQYHHAGQPGNVCGTEATDLGTGEMRVELSPGAGNHYYLVTAFGGGVEGPSGYDSIGLEIPASQSTCTP